MSIQHQSVCITIRYAVESDSFPDIARCLYLTDPYIYPAAFGTDPEQAARAIASLMRIPGSLFDYRRMIVGLIDGHIKAVILYSEPGICWNQQQCEEAVRMHLPDISAFRYVSQAYFSQEAAVEQEHFIELVACCVAPEARRQGLASRMLQFLINEKKGHMIGLDVLADNVSAIALYEKWGFSITGRMKGFSIDPNNLPECFRMIRHSAND